MESDMVGFGEKLRSFRISSGKTQSELGEAVGVPQATISKWEKGLQKPSSDHASKLQDLTGMPMAELLGLEVRAEPKASQNEGFAEMKQAGFSGQPTGALPIASEKTGKPGRHPAFGVWKGKVTLLPDYDYTQPADPDWGKVYED
jgi:transcriptional regulator with XRE-family HTH domain